MVIRRAQMEQIVQRQVEAFESSLIVLLRSEFPEACNNRNDVELAEEIRAVVRRADRSYQIQEENALMKFVFLTFLLGDGFDLLPAYSWIQDILRHRRSASERMEIIMSGVAHHLEKDEERLPARGRL